MILWNSRMLSPVAYQSSWFGVLSLGWQLQNLGYYMYGTNLSLLREDLKVEGSLPIVRFSAWVKFMERVYLSLSYLFQCGYVHSCPMCRSYLNIFCISLRGNWAMCSCIFGTSVGGGKFRSLLGDFLKAPGFKLKEVE